MARYQRHKLTLPSPSEPFTLVYHEWLPDKGGQDNPAVFCVHGLTRNGRDFDVLAGALADRGRRVICPDVAGRGESGWLQNHAEYNNPNYGQHLAGLIIHLGLTELDWVGTSMGGLIGMGAAAIPNTMIRRLVINDVGAVVPAAALNRIGDYVGKTLRFDSLPDVEAHLRTVHAPFGPLTDAQWRHLATHSARRDGDFYRLAYDPGIADAFSEMLTEDLDIWSVWDAITVETLLVRGATSDLLLADTAQEMTERGPKAMLVEIEGCGHAPALMADDQVEVICRWLCRP